MKPLDKSAFTLIEVLVVLTVIALLAGILLPALGQAKTNSKQAKSLSDLRQTMVAYTCDHVDHKGYLLPGYYPYARTIHQGKLAQVTGTDEQGHALLGVELTRYPWRLVPYLTDPWSILFSHTAPPSGNYARSNSPSFGLNSVFVGGHNSVFYKGYDTNNIPITNRHVVFRDIEIIQPTNLIIFTEAKYRNIPGGATEGESGTHTANSPFADSALWEIQDGKIKTTHPARGVGIPEGRYSDKTLTTYFDGHAARESPSDLADMRLWANWATSENDTIDTAVK